MERRIFIGDIQGCQAELEELLERAQFDPAHDRLEPVGDLVNRGPDSLGVLRLLRSLGAGGVLGNHDLHLLRVVAGKRSLRPSDTLDEILAAEDRDALCAWLAQRRFVKRWPDVWLVHGGFDPRWTDPEAALAASRPLAGDAPSDFATRVRYCDDSGARPPRDDPPPMLPYRPWFEHWRARVQDQRTVVFGHWAQRGLIWQEKLRGLDTGCVWGGKLSAWIAEEDRLVQVDARRRWSEFD